jgi:hypothetical protein
MCSSSLSSEHYKRIYSSDPRNQISFQKVAQVRKPAILQMQNYPNAKLSKCKFIQMQNYPGIGNKQLIILKPQKEHAVSAYSWYL